MWPKINNDFKFKNQKTVSNFKSEMYIIIITIRVLLY